VATLYFDRCEGALLRNGDHTSRKKGGFFSKEDIASAREKTRPLIILSNKQNLRNRRLGDRGSGEIWEPQITTVPRVLGKEDLLVEGEPGSGPLLTDTPLDGARKPGQGGTRRFLKNFAL